MYDSNLFSIALAISIVYCFLKFFELRFQEEEEKKPLKMIIKDSAFVFISSIIGLSIMSQFNPMKGGNGSSNPSAFIDTPAF